MYMYTYTVYSSIYVHNYLVLFRSCGSEVTAAVVFSGRGKCPAGRGVAYAAVQLLAGSMAGVLTAAYQTETGLLLRNLM